MLAKSSLALNKKKNTHISLRCFFIRMIQHFKKGNLMLLIHTSIVLTNAVCISNKPYVVFISVLFVSQLHAVFLSIHKQPNV